MSDNEMMERIKQNAPMISFVAGAVIFPFFPLGAVAAWAPLANKVFNLLKAHGEIKKIDEEFVVNIIKAGKESGAEEINLEFSKSQMAGLDLSLPNVREKAGFDLDLGIKGDTKVVLNVKYRNSASE